MPLHFTGMASRREMEHPEEYASKEAPTFDRVLKWDPKQPRDKDGRWTSGGGGRRGGTMGAPTEDAFGQPLRGRRRGRIEGLSEMTVGEAIKPGGPAYGGPLHGAPGSFRRGPEFGLSKMTLGEASKPGGPAHGGPQASLSGFRARGTGKPASGKPSKTTSPPPGVTTLEFTPGVSPDPKPEKLPYLEGKSPAPGATNLPFKKDPPFKTNEAGGPVYREGKYKQFFKKVQDTHTGSLKSPLKPTKRSSFS